MSKQYNQVSRDIWHYGEEKSISQDDFYIFLYLLTGPHANWSGTFFVSVSRIAHATGCNRARVEDALGALERAGVILYESEIEAIHMCDIFELQCVKNGNHLRAAYREIEDEKGLPDRIRQAVLTALTQHPKCPKEIHEVIDRNGESDSVVTHISSAS